MQIKRQNDKCVCKIHHRLLNDIIYKDLINEEVYIELNEMQEKRR